MNVPRYKFAKETEPELLHFLKIANDLKLSNKNCSHQEYEKWNKVLPLELTLLEKLHKPPEDSNKIINISSDEEELHDSKYSKSNENTIIEQIEDIAYKSSINDIVFTIKENLETINDLSESTVESIRNCSSSECEELFELLNTNLNNEETFYLGESLQKISSINLINTFCHFVLIPKVQQEYCEHLSVLTNNLYNSKLALDLNKDIVTVLLQASENNTKIFLQYLNNLKPNYQSTLLRDFIFNIENLNNKGHLLITESLLNNHVEYETLNKLVEMLSNIAENHTKDKAFGKLLMNVIHCLGTNVLLLEQPLKHIIAGHKSVWKSKLEKTFNTHYEDTLMFSQSFRI